MKTILDCKCGSSASLVTYKGEYKIFCDRLSSEHVSVSDKNIMVVIRDWNSKYGE